MLRLIPSLDLFHFVLHRWNCFIKKRAFFQKLRELFILKKISLSEKPWIWTCLLTHLLLVFALGSTRELFRQVEYWPGQTYFACYLHTCKIFCSFLIAFFLWPALCESIALWKLASILFPTPLSSDLAASLGNIMICCMLNIALSWERVAPLSTDPIPCWSNHLLPLGTSPNRVVILTSSTNWSSTLEIRSNLWFPLCRKWGDRPR